MGLFVAGDGTRIVGNRIAEVFRQGIHAEGSGMTIAANVLEQVGTPGENSSALHVVGRGAAGHLIERNLVVGNLGIGIYVDDGAGNASTSPHVVSDNLVVGNRAAGIKVVLAARSGGARINGNSLYANDGESGNCGLMTLSAGPAIDATNNWWGSPAGPGADPSDDVCSVGTAPDTGAAAVTPFVRVAPAMR